MADAGLAESYRVALDMWKATSRMWQESSEYWKDQYLMVTHELMALLPGLHPLLQEDRPDDEQQLPDADLCPSTPPPRI
jgi:hypothetical protein